MSVTFLILRFRTCPVHKSWWGKREESIKAIKTNTTPIFNKFFLILWFLCLIMTHRGNPYLLFLTVEAWGGGYAFLWSRCIITKYSSSCIESRWIKTFYSFSSMTPDENESNIYSHSLTPYDHIGGKFSKINFLWSTMNIAKFQLNTKNSTMIYMVKFQNYVPHF